STCSFCFFTYSSDRLINGYLSRKFYYATDCLLTSRRADHSSDDYYNSCAFVCTREITPHTYNRRRGCICFDCSGMYSYTCIISLLISKEATCQWFIYHSVERLYTNDRRLRNCCIPQPYDLTNYSTC